MTKRLTQEAPAESRWSYDSPFVDCKRDPGYCGYLRILSTSHDRGLIYAGIFWATIVAILLLWGLVRWLRHVGTGRSCERHLATEPAVSTLEDADGQFPRILPVHHIRRSWHAVMATFRSILVPGIALKSVFGHATRLQVVILAALLGYLTVWSFVDIAYTAWKPPVASPSNTDYPRASLASFSNRVGTLAFSLTPISVLLATRESLLSVITGIPYTSFIFLHRWTGYTIVAQATIHTAGWCVVKHRPQTWNAFIDATHARWGIVATCAIILMAFLSLGWTVRRLTGYEFFRKAHYLLAVLYMGACIGHWRKLDVFLIPALALWLIDRFIRIVRMATIHYSASRGWGWFRFSTIEADAKYWQDERYGDIIRLNFLHPLQQERNSTKKPPWKIGQHFFLCFTEGSIWQSHPFTPLSLPMAAPPTGQEHACTGHSYLFRAKAGETKRIGKIIAEKIEKHERDFAGAEYCKANTGITTRVILQGPYGSPILPSCPRSDEPNSDNQTRSGTNLDILCIAGGTGISYVLPVILHYLCSLSVNDQQPREEISNKCNQISHGLNLRTTRPKRKIELIWTTKRANDIQWIEPELEELQNASNAWKAEYEFRIRLFVTAESSSEIETLRSKAAPSSVGATADQHIPSSSSSVPSTNRSPAYLGRERHRLENGTPITPQRYDSGSEIDTHYKRPEFPVLLKDFTDKLARGPIHVFASGPPGMTRDVRSAVAGCNSGRRVWKGDDRFDVRLVCDDRCC